MVGRRREDPRPPIEVIGDEPAVDDAMARITVGDEGRRRRRVLALAALAVVAVVAVSVAIGGGEDPEAADPTTTTTERTGRATRRTTQSTEPEIEAPLGLQLSVDTGAALLLGGYGRADWLHLDLDTGTRSTVDLGRSDFTPPIAVRGGIVMSLPTETRFVPVPAGEPVRLGAPSQVYAADADHVWLVAGADPWLQEPPVEPPVARLVEARTGREIGSPVQLPGDGYARGATSAGLVVVAGGQVYLAAPGRAIEPLGAGDVLGVSRSHVVLTRCDDAARCEVVALEVGSGRVQPLDIDPFLRWLGVNVIVSDAGELAVFSYGPQQTLALGSVADGRLVGSIDAPNGPGWGQWLPDGQGFATVIGDRLVRLVVEDGTVVERPMTAAGRALGEILVVIPG